MAHRRWSEVKAAHLDRESADAVRREVLVHSRDIRLRQLREMLNRTQEELAEALGKTQVSLSKSEGRTDCLVSTLAEYIEALGGKLRLYAEVEGTLYPISISTPPTSDSPLESSTSQATTTRRTSPKANKAAPTGPKRRAA